MQNFRNLRVWHAAHEMSVNITNSFPERAGGRAPGLRSQIIRAAQSVPANIAEGCGKHTQTEFLHFVEIALSSANELEGHLIYAHDTHQLTTPSFEFHTARVVVVRKMLSGLHRKAQHAVAVEANAKRSTRRQMGASTIAQERSSVNEGRLSVNQKRLSVEPIPLFDHG